VSVSGQTPRSKQARFGFGENWKRFARDLEVERIEAARASLVEWLGQASLEGCSFLDVGSGSGLFSLAAALMGSHRIHSFDYDPQSVATTQSLRDRFEPDTDWTVEGGDAVDSTYMDSLGQWDIVYAWGVLHHTGDMWLAMDLTCARVKPGGRLFLSIYNDQGRASGRWRRVKKLYNALPPRFRVPYSIIVMAPIELRALFRYSINGRFLEYFRLWRTAGAYGRGMSRWHDLLDWVGGYPFEVATPERVFEFCAQRRFELRKLKTCRGSPGNNQFVFELPIGATN
jgi:2-polyprenyl-3-methyl-5-hydroxy-6-metoxy-1,4-benzoquinol methylase